MADTKSKIKSGTDEKSGYQEDTKTEKPERIVILRRNGKNEKKFQLFYEPMDIFFRTGEIPIYAQLKVKNTSKERQCVKIKTTSNNHFRSNPSHEFLEVDEEAFFKLTMLKYDEGMENDGHYFGVFHRATDEKDFKKVFVKSGNEKTYDGLVRLHISFEGNYITQVDATNTG